MVDDEPTIRTLVSEVLQEMGCYSLVAADGVTALKVLHSESRIDVLITDVRMPGGLDGVELAERARQDRPTLKVLFMSGYAEDGALANGDLRLGMQVLAKPFALETLAKELNELLT